MIAPFDIFEVERGGGLLWRGSAATLDEAQARVREFGKSSPGEYIIKSIRTGNKMVVKSDGQGLSQGQSQSQSQSQS